MLVFQSTSQGPETPRTQRSSAAARCCTPATITCSMPRNAACCIRFLLANPRVGWIDELLRPTGIDPQEYLQDLHVNASRVFMPGKAAEARWQPFPIPWWFVIADNNVVHLKAIDMAGRPPAIQLVDATQVKYFRDLFALAWEKAESVAVFSSSTATTKPALHIFLRLLAAINPRYGAFIGAWLRMACHHGLMREPCTWSRLGVQDFAGDTTVRYHPYMHVEAFCRQARLCTT